MKKTLIISCAMLLLISSVSFAGTRVETMGDNNTVLLDDNNIWLFPSRINDYPNLATGEFGWNSSTEGELTNFGINWQFNEDNPFVVGTYFSVLPADVPQDLFGSDLVPFDSSLQDNRRIDLLYGRQFGTYNFGFGLSFLHSSMTADAPGDQSKEAFGYYRFSFGLTPDNGIWDLAADIGLGSWTDENYEGKPETESDGFSDLAVRGRYFYQMNPTCTFIPHVGLSYSKRGIKNNVIDEDPVTHFTDASDLDYSLENKSTAMNLGMGLNYTPATNVLGVMDFGFMYSKQKREDDTTGTFIRPAGFVTYGEEDLTTWFFPYFKIGLDADIFKWLDLRMGATSYWTSESDEIGVAKYNARWPENETYLGFGFHFNRLHIDTKTDPTLFLQGLNFISGGDEHMNFKISATYEMM
ncbi:MAG: hypothetical protein DRP47_05475 [Candidatus Zixiibacteriota bacterium]|nr:MAG: hypothetical protein DRP47_05475 [candidate division Zixibacteria bacterium]